MSKKKNKQRTYHKPKREKTPEVREKLEREHLEKAITEWRKCREEPILCPLSEPVSFFTTTTDKAILFCSSQCKNTACSRNTHSDFYDTVSIHQLTLDLWEQCSDYLE